MTNKPLNTMSIAELAPLIESKEVSPVEVTEAVLQAIKEKNETINAYVTVTEEEAMDHAKKAEADIQAGNYSGPLHGIPLAIKDNINMKGIRATHGSKIHSDNIATEDAAVVTQLLGKGMIPVGKTNLHEYACGITTTNPFHGPTRNPWNTERIPGGSSGGSGAALAADMTIASLGTDTAGSIRIPSACCGTVGLKPTFGRVSKAGAFPLSWTFDHIGPMTKTVADAGIMLEAIAQYDTNDPTSVNKPFTYERQATEQLNDIVIGIPDVQLLPIEKSVKEGLDRTVDLLQELGAEVRTIQIATLESAPLAGYATLCVEAAAIHQENLINYPEDFGPDVAGLLKFGSVITGTQYAQAQQLRRVIIDEMNQLLTEIDVVLMPTIPLPAPKIGDLTVEINGEELGVTDAIITYPALANVTGLPSLALPSGLSEDGLPVGVQLVGPMFGEQKLLTIGELIETHNPLPEKP